MNKHSKKDLIFIDIETTGLDIRKDCCIEIGAIRCAHDGKRIAVWDAKVTPAIPVNIDAAAINGYSNAEWETATSFQSAISGLYHKMLNVSSEPYQFVSWFGFDFDIIERQCEDTRIQCPLGATPRINAADVLFPLVLTERVASRRLTDVADFLGLPPRTSHRALADAETLCAVWFEYLQQFNLAWCSGEIAQSAVRRIKQWLSR